MDLRCRQQQMRIAWPDNPSGWYYWTNTYYYDLDNPPTTNDSNYWLAIAVLHIHTSAVQRNRSRVGVPPEPISWSASTTGFNEPGGIPIESGYSPFDTALLKYYSGDKQVGFTRLRCPVQADDQVNGNLHPDFHSYLVVNANDHLLRAKICSRYGEPITEIRVDEKVHGWQFRDGTERRQRQAIT